MDPSIHAPSLTLLEPGGTRRDFLVWIHGGLWGKSVKLLPADHIHLLEVLHLLLHWRRKMVRKPLTPTQPQLLKQQPQHWVPRALTGPGCPEDTCCTGAGRGRAADRTLGTAQAMSEPLILSGFQGSHKAASLTSTCCFQAFTSQVRTSAVKLKMSSVAHSWPGPLCHHLVSLEPPSPHPYSHTGRGHTPTHRVPVSASARGQVSN